MMLHLLPKSSKLYPIAPTHSAMLKHFLLSCLLCALFAPGFAQQPISVYAEAGVGPRYRDVPYSVRAGLEFGRHDLALEYGIGSGTYQGYRYGVRYRHFLAASSADVDVQPFLQGGFSWNKRDFPIFGNGVSNRSALVDLAAGLQVWLWRGLRVSGHAGLRYMQPFAGPDAPFVYDLGPRLYVVGGVGLAYSVPRREDKILPHSPLPASAKPMLPRHEVGIGLTVGHVAHLFRYSDLRLHYALRVHRLWDLRAAVDLPNWPLGTDYPYPYMEYWRPGVYAGARFWALPATRFSVFADAGLAYGPRFDARFAYFIHRDPVFEPCLGAGVRANFHPNLSLEVSSQLRLMPYRGIPQGIADNAVHLGLNYRFGKSYRSDILENI